MEGFVAPVTPGRMILECEGVPYEVAKEALRLAAQKLPVTTKFVVRREARKSSNKTGVEGRLGGKGGGKWIQEE